MAELATAVGQVHDLVNDLRTENQQLRRQLTGALDLLTALCIQDETSAAGITGDEFSIYCIYCEWETQSYKGAIKHDDDCPIARGAAFVARAQEASGE